MLLSSAEGLAASMTAAREFGGTRALAALCRAATCACSSCTRDALLLLSGPSCMASRCSNWLITSCCSRTRASFRLSSSWFSAYQATLACNSATTPWYCARMASICAFTSCTSASPSCICFKSTPPCFASSCFFSARSLSICSFISCSRNSLASRRASSSFCMLRISDKRAAVSLLLPLTWWCPPEGSWCKAKRMRSTVASFSSDSNSLIRCMAATFSC
mmetsp:Transcript_2680/g.6220  ORF Transcript_2680/g.6220 Transcript_2680/m.6220 type:complete len:219 (+) Transcript_2680:1-657(+)